MSSLTLSTIVTFIRFHQQQQQKWEKSFSKNFKYSIGKIRTGSRMKSGIGDQLDSTDRHIVDEHVHLNQTDNIVSSTITMPATTFNNNNNEFSYNHYGQQEDIAIKSDVNPLIIYVVPPEDCSNDNNSNNDYNKRMRGSLRSKQQNGSQQQQFNQKMDNVLLQPTNSANNGYNNNIGDNNNTNKNSNSNIVINSSLPDNIRRTTRRLDRDSRSVDTSTSEVNSNDDADSIVSRLSMIVSEQEEMNNKFDSENTLEQFNYSNHKNNNTHYDTKGIRKISELSLATSNGNTMSLGTRPRSFTVNTVDNVCKNCSIASPASKETLARPPSDNNTMRPLQANDNSIENMLTITRSTWTLSEFDRIFPKVTSKERKRSTDMTPNSIPTNFCNFVNYEPNNNTANANRFHQVDLGIPDLHNSNNSSNNNSGNQQQISAIGKQPQSALTTDNKEQQLRNRSGTDSSQETIMSSNSCTAGDKSSRWARRNITRYVPSIEWLMNYEYKQWLFGDIMAGLVVASLNVSLCLAAGLLADVDAGVAFRSSIVNTFIYAIFCTSRHTSFGAYSIMALMASVTVQKAMNDEMVMIRLELGPSASMSKDEYELWRYKIMIFYTFLTGLVQLVGGLLGLGTIVASFMPEALCSSMLASTAIAMAVGQLANMCGLNYRNLYELQTGDPSQVLSSTFKWCRQLLLLFENLHLINYVCLALSLTSIILLFANNYVFQQRLEKIFKRKILIPFELLILVLSTVISYAWNLEKDHQVETSGPVLITFDLPTMPDLRLIQELWLDALVAGLISFTLTATLAKLLAQKLNYELDSNQELIACGLGNIAGGLFDALPASGTAIRSTTQVAVGGQTQLASMINCLVLVLLAQTCGELISPLPRVSTPTYNVMTIIMSI